MVRALTEALASKAWVGGAGPCSCIEREFANLHKCPHALLELVSRMVDEFH
jgi:hypothetical protein